MARTTETQAEQDQSGEIKADKLQALFEKLLAGKEEDRWHGATVTLVNTNLESIRAQLESLREQPDPRSFIIPFFSLTRHSAGDISYSLGSGIDRSFVADFDREEADRLVREAYEGNRLNSTWFSFNDGKVLRIVYTKEEDGGYWKQEESELTADEIKEVYQRFAGEGIIEIDDFEKGYWPSHFREDHL